MQKPAKPSPDFPLYAHASGRWAKKVRGKFLYFGRWDDPTGALREYEKYLKGSPISDMMSEIRLSVLEATDRFMVAKRLALEQGSITQSTYSDYLRTSKWVLEHFGKYTPVEGITPSDFSAYKAHLAERRTVNSLGNEITRVRVLFKWAYDSRLISGPVHFGPDFKRPSKKVLRRHKRIQGKKLFTREQIHRLLDECGIHMKAMVLLGINCGFGNTDCATLPLAAVNLDEGWIDFPRPKTEVDRLCPLWPETIAALKVSACRRPEPKPEAASHYFVRYSGACWVSSDNWIAKQTHANLLRAGIKRGGFYWLRHTFETIGGGAKDQVAVDAIMGHVDPSMAATYREEIDRSRLTDVSNHVRSWLFASN